MALCAVFLTGGSKEGKLWFALGRLGTLLLAIACWLVWQRYGTLDSGLLGSTCSASNCRWLRDIRAARRYRLRPAGRGLSRHTVAPQAHANASAPPPRAVLDRGDENRVAGHSHAISRLAAMRRCGGAWRCWCLGMITAFKWFVRADGA